MKGKDLYEFYKHQEVSAGKGMDGMECRGIVVGYEDTGDCAIIKVTQGQGWAEEEQLPGDFIETEHLENELGHYYVGKSLLKMAQQIKRMKLWKVDFEAMYPVPSGLIIAARTKEKAEEIAKETITHTKPKEITEHKMDQEGVVFYESGEY